MESQKPFFKMINELCKDKNIEQKEISYGWIKRLTKNGVSHDIIGNQLDINGAVSYNIAGDKYATYEILNSNNIPVIPHKMIFSPVTRKNYFDKDFLEMTTELLRQSNNKVVIKANDSYEGKDVYYCSTEKEIADTIDKLFEENNDTLSICPYLDIDYEYRAIYLYGEIIYIYKKKKAFVTGDGKSNLYKLIQELKEKKHIEESPNLDLKYVPEVGEEVTVSWKHNLCNGAVPMVVEDRDEYIDKVIEIAIKAGKEIGIKFASIDVAVTSNNEVLIMEINKSVCMNKFTELIPNGYEIAKEVYSKAIDKMFEM